MASPLTLVAALAATAGLTGCSLSSSGATWSTARQTSSPSAALPRPRARELDRRRRRPRRGVPARPPGRLRPGHVRGPRAPPDPPPAVLPQHDRTGKGSPLTPAKLVTERTPATSPPTWPPAAAHTARTPDARLGRQWQGQGRQRPGDGELDIPASPSARFAYTFPTPRQARPGDDKSQNKASIDHDISIEGNGVDEKGQVVKDGDVAGSS